MDQIGPYTFIKLSRPPDRAQRQWAIVGISGIHGVQLWDLGERGVPFTVQSQAFETTYALGRAAIPNYQLLVTAGPVSVIFGVLEVEQIFKVLRVEPVDVKRIVLGKVGGDSTNYQALVIANWTLMPLNPFVSPP
jgi:hypothetical protein